MEKEDTSILQSSMISPRLTTLRNGSLIIMLLATKVWCVLANKKKYSFEYKLHVVELYLTSEVSYQELAIQEGIRNPALIVKWVNDFRIAGPDALRPKKKGRKKPLSLKKKSNRYQCN